MKKFLGIEVGGKCTGRDGILQQLHEGEWITIARNMDDSPRVFHCEHEAMAMVATIIDELTKRLVKQAKEEGVTLAEAPAFMLENLPKPQDFRYQFVDEDIEDIEVKDTTEATAALAKVMGGAA